MTNLTRRLFLGQATASLAALSAMRSSANPQLVYKRSDWNVAGFNQLVKYPSRVKQVFDENEIGGGKFLNNIKNSLNGLHFGFGIPSDQIKIVAAMHGSANTLNFDDYVWQKYRVGEWLKVQDPRTGQPAVRNPFFAGKAAPETHYATQDPDNENSLFQDTSIQALQLRGVQFLCCHTATEEQSRALIKQFDLSQKPEEIVKDLLAHTVPDVLVVASMVSAIALLQSEGHYSYITV
ncbi:MAG: Tat pathway signal sequence domain protein [Candidatus Acidoferrum typicum]|nr:Tat pathway signal sequence domain protein [Candidatus Acidoferrum typicum]